VRLNSLVVGPSNIPVEVVFLDKDGQALKQTTQNIAPEHFESFDLNFDSLGRSEIRSETRFQLRVLVKYPVTVEHYKEERVYASLEIIDNKTDKTTFVLSVPEPPELPAMPESR